MSIKERIQDEIKNAMRNRNHTRLEVLRMAKAALLNVEKSGGRQGELTDEEAYKAIGKEVKKRRQAVEVYTEHGKDDKVAEAEAEIKVLEEFLPRQLSPEEIEAKVREYIEQNPSITHPGKLTGALKKELGEQADGKTLNEICRKVLDE